MNENDPLAPYIRSLAPGRLRLRHPALRGEKAASGLETFLRGTDGVIAADVNRRVGSLLLLWDPEKLDLGTLRSLAQAALPALPSEPVPRRASSGLSPFHASASVNRMVNRGMAVSYAAVLLSILPGMRGRMVALHVGSGVFFTALLLWHMIRYRKTVF